MGSSNLVIRYNSDIENTYYYDHSDDTIVQIIGFSHHGNLKYNKYKYDTLYRKVILSDTVSNMIRLTAAYGEWTNTVVDEMRSMIKYHEKADSEHYNCLKEVFIEKGSKFEKEITQATNHHIGDLDPSVMFLGKSEDITGPFIYMHKIRNLYA